MSTKQRRALAATIPTTEVIKDAVTFPRDRLGEPLDISPERFDAWLAVEVRKAKAEAWDRAYWQGVQDEIDSQGFDGGMTGPNRINPYRETGDSDEHR